MRVCPTDGTRLYQVDDSDPLIGGVIDGRFRVDYTLGVGGMGTVYGGVQLSVNRDVAIKVLRTELTNREVALERFFREAKTISKLTHPNIVKLIDFGQDRERGVLYLVMELVRGQNLGDLLAQGRLRTPLALDVVYQVCGALTEPHSEGVIHRDLKPDNLLLVPVSDGTLQVKVLDFGIARFMESNTQLTGTGMICGTPAYMAPEQAQNEKLDARTDLYALGVILYEMLSGWPPFSGTSSLQVMLKHIQERPPTLRELLPPTSLPKAIEEVVYALMSKERALRPKSAHDVRKQIEDLRAEFGFRPIRVNLGSEVDEALAPFLLQKLPSANHERSGPTQALRRETGLQRGATPDPGDSAPTNIWVGETQADEALGVTGPLSPEKQLEVAADARGVKVQTRGGGQQAWTPGDQAAVRSIKDTKDGVDALGVTVDSEAFADAGGVRRTMLEADNSEPMLQVAPRTEEVLEVKRDPDATITKERRPATSGSSNLPLFGIAIAATAAVGLAAMFISDKLDALKAPPRPVPVVAPPPVALPVEEAVDPGAIANFVTASISAQGKLHTGVAKAARAARPIATSKAKPPIKVVEQPKKPAEAKKPAPDKPKSKDPLEGLELRDAQ